MNAPDVTLAGTLDGTRLEIRVIPRASRTAVDGVRDGRLIVRVTAPPVDRAANTAAVRALADALGLPASAIHIIAGHTSRNKTVTIAAPKELVRHRLQAILA